MGTRCGHRSLAPFWLVILMVVSASSSRAADDTNPPSGSAANSLGTPCPPGAVKAVVVKSYDSPFNWDTINQEWSAYGSVPVCIDFESLRNVKTVSLDDLIASGADVVILGDPAGYRRTWTVQDMEALQAYAHLGHNLLGTYLVFYWDHDGVHANDNRLLSPLWGIRQDIDYQNVGQPLGETRAAPSADILAPLDCVFERIADPLDFGGYPEVQLPTDGSWDEADLAGATFLARSDDGHNVVTAYRPGRYQAIFISYLPEFATGMGNQQESYQLLYNAILCAADATPAFPSSWGRMKVRYR